MKAKTRARALRPARLAAYVSGLALLGACATAPPQPTYTYTPPNGLESISNSRTIDASFDDTWKALIDYVSGTYFQIRNFEKASGLLTLSFGAADIPRFVDCGMWQQSGSPPVPYIDRNMRYRLDGQMNLFVESVTPQRTRIRVTTHYVLRDGAGNVYEFTSNAPATIHPDDLAPGTIPTRTCRSTHAAEKQILTGISAISSR